jgi:hypothetical protein
VQRARRGLPPSCSRGLCLLWLASLELVLLGLLSSAGLAACATLPAPDTPSRALYLDMRRLVESRQRLGWVLDRRELEEAAPTALLSVCRVSPDVREETLGWIGGRLLAEGGSAREVYARAGDDLSAAHEALTLERTLALLTHVASTADADCPFWLTPDDAAFRGVHTSRDRFALILESRGQAGLYALGDRVAFGGGGGGRLMPAWGVSDRFTWALGIELGGSGLIATGETQELDAIITTAAPMLFRWYDLSRVYDLEVAAVAFFTTDDVSLLPGGRVSFATGLATPRVGSFMPVGVLQLSYELHPARGVFPMAHVVSVGTRVGFEVDF